MNPERSDAIALAALMTLTGAFAAVRVDFAIPPFEDAAMLMRYAAHLALGKGIVWNPGEPPLDGATDFLFLLLVGVVSRVGFPVEIAARLVAGVAHVATVGLIYSGMRRWQGSGVLAAFLSAAYFAVGPGLFLVASCFGTSLFVLAVAAAWLLGQRILLPGRGGTRDYLAFSIACLASGVARPEGVFLSVLMLVAVVMLLPRDRARLVTVFGTVFVILGGAYFAWRWSYFGHPLPNPFYTKGGGRFYCASLRASLRNGFWLTLPLLAALLPAVRIPGGRRRLTATLIPVLGFLAIWVLLSNEMNFAGRFQYPVLALAVLSWYPLVRGGATDGRPVAWAPRRASAVVAAVVGVVMLFAIQIHRSSGFTCPPDGRQDVGRLLARYADRGYTLATTEAGLLPLYSTWRAVDTWGLNDRWIAHHGGVAGEYLAAVRPDVIVWHERFSPCRGPEIHRATGRWFYQVMALKRYAETNGFTLAAAYGIRPDDTHYYYVRAGLPDHDAIVRGIRTVDYRWLATGEPARNYILGESGPLP